MHFSSDAQGLAAMFAVLLAIAGGIGRCRAWLRRGEARRQILWGRPGINGTDTVPPLAVRTRSLEDWRTIHMTEAHRVHGD